MFLKGSGKKNFFVWGLLILFSISISFTACDVGLGSTVNTSVPRIDLPDDGVPPGSFLDGSDNKIILEIGQDSGFPIEEVIMTVWFDPIDPSNPPEGAKQDDAGNWYIEIKGEFDQSLNDGKGAWFVNLDTTGMKDGTIKTKVKATDSSGKSTTTTDMIYTIKNMLPQVELTLPKISHEGFDDPDMNIHLDSSPIIKGNDIMGIATDLAGIAKGYPQIMLWPVEKNKWTDFGFNGVIDAEDAPDGWDREFGQWHSMTDSRYRLLSEIGINGEKTVQFRWPLYKMQKENGKYRPVTTQESANIDNILEVGQYEFKIRVKDAFGRLNYYPNRSDNEIGENGRPVPPEAHPNKTIKVRLAEATNPNVKVSVDSFYNKKEDFEATVTILTGNEVRVINAALKFEGDIEDFEFSTGGNEILADNNPDGKGGITNKEGSVGNIFTVKIPKEKVKSDSGEVALHIKATDNESQDGYGYAIFIVDTTPPALEYVQPAGLTTSSLLHLTSEVTIQGIASDGEIVTKLYYVLGKTEDCGSTDPQTCTCGWIDTYIDDRINIPGKRPQEHKHGSVTIDAGWNGLLSNWSFKFKDIADIVTKDADYYVTAYGSAGDNLWELPIKFKVEDKAGNVRIERIKVIIAPDLDIPKVQFNSHDPKGTAQTVGGKVNINGLAVDNEWINNVEIRISKETSTDVYDVIKDYNEEPKLSLGSRGSTVTWSYDLNENNTYRGKHKIEIRARDAYASSTGTAKPARTGAQAGKDTETLYLIFDPDVPVINAKIVQGLNENPVLQGITTQVRGDITINLEISDNQKIESITTRTTVRTQTNPTGTTSAWSGNYITTNPKPMGAVVTPNDYGKGYYKVSIPLNTKNLAENFVWTLEVEAKDNTAPVAYTAQLSISLMPDNEAPKIQFIEPQGWKDTVPDTPEVTSALTIRGTVTDNQQVSKLYYAMGEAETAGGIWTDTLLDANSPRASHPGYPGKMEWDGTLSSWNVVFSDTADFFIHNTDFLVQDGTSNKWFLEFWIKAVDTAGNETILKRSVKIDPDADLPTIELTSHPTENQTISGNVTLSGLAKDNERVQVIEIRITRQTDASVLAGTSLYNANGSIIAGNSQVITSGEDEGFLRLSSQSAPFSVPSTLSGINFSYTMGAASTNVNWSLNIPEAALIYQNGNREFFVEVRARDSSNLEPGKLKEITRPATTKGFIPVETQKLNFAGGAPSFPVVEVIRGTFGGNAATIDTQYTAFRTAGRVEPYSPGESMITGEVTFRVIAEDDGDLAAIRVHNQNWSSANNNVNRIDTTAPNTITPFVQAKGKASIPKYDGNLDAGTKQRYVVYIPINTANKGSNPDMYNFTVDVEDNTMPVSQKGQQTIAIVVDAAPPGITFIEPLQNAADSPYVTSTVVIRGNLTDNQKVRRMFYVLGERDVKAVYGGNHQTGTPSKDASQWISALLGSVDSDPAGAFPSSERPRNNHPDAKFTATPIRASWALSTGLSSWTWRFENIADVVATEGGLRYDYVTTSGSSPNLFVLPIAFKIEDYAGNISFQKIELIVDPESDNPKVSISSHNNSQTVGGSIRINGMAEDNDLIYSVQYRIYMESDAQAKSSTEKPSVNALDDWTKHNWAGSEGWRDVIIPSLELSPPVYASMVSWNVEINKDSALSPPAKVGSVSYIRRVLVQFRAIDSALGIPSPKLYGQPVNLLLNFDDTVPYIQNERIFLGLPSTIGETALRNGTGSTSYVQGTTRIHGPATMRITVGDESGIQAVNLRSGAESIDLRSASNNIYIIPDDTYPWIETNSTPEIAGNDEFYIFIPMNTDGASKIGGGYENRAEVFPISITVTDTVTGGSQAYIAQNSYQMEVDNRYPYAKYTGATFARGTVKLEGTATDTATGIRVMGVDKVVVYLSRLVDSTTRKIVHLSGSAGTVDTVLTTDNSTGQKARTGRVEGGAEGTLVTLPFFPTLGANSSSSTSGIVIDARDTDTLYTGKNWSGSSVITWAVDLDTTKLSDGKYNLHYVVFDTVGNAAHYVQEIYIANKPPVITSIELGTDLDLSGGVSAGLITAGGEYVAFNTIGDKEMATNFRVRNNYFNLNVNTSSGNNNKNYRVAYVYRSAAAVAFTNIVKGQVYTIANPGENVKWLSYGVFGEPEAGTTFTATQSYNSADGGSDGTIYRYTLTSDGTDYYTATSTNTAKIRTSAATGNTASAISFNGTGAFGDSSSAALIRESEGIALDTSGNFTWYGNGKCSCTPVNNAAWHVCTASTNNRDAYKRFFLVHVYDTTVSTATGGVAADQLSDVALINVGINNTDTFAPQIEYAGFGFKHTIPTSASEKFNYVSRERIAFDTEGSEYNRNIVTATVNATSGIGTGTRKGYVQYTAHSSALDSRDNISGMVIFKGKAMDNRQVQRITAQIQYYPNATPVAGTEFAIAVWSTTNRRLEAATTAATPTASGSTDTIAAMRTSDTQAWGFSVEEAAVDMEFGHVLNWNFAWDTSTINNMARDSISVTFRVYDAATGGQSASTSTTVNIKPYISEVVTPLSKAYGSNPSAFSRSATGWYPVKENDIITIKGFNLGVNNNGTLTALRINTTNLTHNNAATVANGNFRIVGKNEITANVGATATSGALLVTVNSIGSINNTNHATAHYNQEPNNLNNNTLTDDRNVYVWRVGAFHTNAGEFPFLNPVMRMDSSSNWYMAYGGSTTSTGELWATKNSATPTAPYTAQNRWRHTTVAHDALGRMYTIAADQTAGATGWRFAQSAGDGTWASTVAADLPAAGGDRYQLPRIATHFAGGTLGTNNRVRVLLSYFDTLSDENRLRLHYGTVNDIGLIAPDMTVANVQTVAQNGETHEGSMFTAVGFLSTGRPVITWYDRTNMNLVLSYGSSAPPNNASTVFTPTNTVSITASSSATAGTGTEYVYNTTNSNHKIPEATGTANNTNTTRVLVNSTVTTGTGTTQTNQLRYARRVTDNTFKLNTDTTAATNLGLDYRSAVNVYAPIVTTGNSGTANNANYRYTLPDGHGLANTDQIYYVNNAANISTGYVRNLDGNNIAIFSAATGGTQYMTARTASMAIYPAKYAVAATRSEERHYIPSAVSLVGAGSTVTITGGNAPGQYIISENWFVGTEIAANTRFKIANTSGAVQNNLGTGNNVITISTPPGWQNNAKIVHSFAGSHVDMVIDAADNVHLAYYDVFNGGLYYALIPPTGTGANIVPNVITDTQYVKVDTYLSAGTRIMLNLRTENGRYVPYISYFHGSFDETRNPIRVAWRKDFTLDNGKIKPGSDDNDRLTGAWEVMTVPAVNVPVSGQLICNGVPTSGTISGAANTGFNGAAGAGSASGGITKSILIGYMTNVDYEGAVLKHNIW